MLTTAVATVCFISHSIFMSTDPVKCQTVRRAALRTQGLGFSKRSDREVDGFDSTGTAAEPETIAVHSAFGAPPADAGGGMFDSDDEDSVW